MLYLFCRLTDEEPVAYGGRHLVTQSPEPPPCVFTAAILEACAVVGTYDEIAKKLRARYGGLATHLEFTIPVATPGEADALRAVLAELTRS